MMDKQQIVIGGHGLPFRVAFLNMQAGAGYRVQAWTQNPFQKRKSEFSVYDHQQDTLARPARNNEIALGVADSPPVLKRYRAFFNEFPVLEPGFAPVSWPFLFTLVAMNLDMSAVRTFDVAPDAVAGGRRQMFFLASYPAGGCFRRLIIEQQAINPISQLIVLHDFHALVF